jgi:low density lipoprotein-related protein 2
LDSVDNVSGVCKSPGPWNLLFSDGTNVISLNTTQRKEREVIFGEKRIQSLDFDPHSHIVFWTDPMDLSIKRSYIPESSNQVEIGHPQVIVSFTKTAVPVDLSVDWVAQNLYWLEMDGQTSKGQVVTAKNDGRYRRSVIPRGIDTPTSIAVNPILGELYWTQAGSNPRIEMAWMDGNDLLFISI